MATLGSQAETVFGKNVVLTLQESGGSSNTYALAREITIRCGNEPIKEEVLNSEVKIYGTGSFDGSFEIENLYSTDSDLRTISTPESDGQLPSVTITCGKTDTTAVSPVTKTLTGILKIEQVEERLRSGQFVIVRATGTVTARPSEA